MFSTCCELLTKIYLYSLDGTCDYVLLSIHVASKFKILDVSNRRCLQHRVSETIPSQALLFFPNLVSEANVEVSPVEIDKN